MLHICQIISFFLSYFFLLPLVPEKYKNTFIRSIQIAEGQKSIYIWGVVYESNITPVVVANFLQEVIFEPEKKEDSKVWFPRYLNIL